MSAIVKLAKERNGQRAIVVTVLLLAVLFPFMFDSLATQMNTAIFVVGYVIMALGLNIVVGFAGLLDIGYVAFYAIGAYTVGWLASDHFTGIGGDEGIHFIAGKFASNLAGIHLNFIFV